ncbi:MULTISPECIES: putative lipid II flippase FtsW [Neorhizobium]|uniref:Probable peptidoglycan glycosyltransferase FtsW n=3 Tax=Neorhizobium galegae TaxID=399 RepID=A0A068SQ58_NEOGA|nr:MULTISPECIES: putative lipid II flippase FtsW [Neorhizobium]KAB1087071.1 putative lipid II flippase FtsW [Neorhizobium galegae]MCJ9674515.1 putative lipid II flippase FtsW [Neorhizobium sp. SHOUNA12B]MCJ9747211.1 putative lipid II flippase FtsW [Neorhizobium sp. SHOUNA12A]MCJ9753876.1 putative lipid II flippase FtsW [Neorhizobium sp. BETTINA12A]MCQ1852367.1 putative lipid II flippase FtsW [Neorhizobium galegae]
MVSRADRGPLADWFWTIDRFFLVAFVLLMGVGFMLSFAASPAVAERIGLNSFHFVERHALFLLPSLVVMIGLSFLTPRQVRRTAIVLLIIALALMVLALFFGVEVKGSRRWIGVGMFSIQPSEFMKPAFVVVCAWLFAEHARQPEIPGNLFAIILFGIVAALLVAQPDLGQTILTSVVWGGMFFMAGMPWLWIVMLGGVGAGGIVTAYYMLPHVTARFDKFLTGEGDRFQIETAHEAILQGGWFGQGPGEGIVKRILPDSHTDFVFSVAAEEFGIIFCMALVAIFAFIVLRGLNHAFKERNDFNRFAVAGLVLQIGMQSLINIGVNLELMPAKGMTLPLISYGGSSMIAICITAGFILALTRHRPEKRAQERSLFRVAQGVPAE